MSVADDTRTGQAVARFRVNWRQAAGESLILLLGVLLALGGQAWWEARLEQQLVRGYVANLLVELESNRAGLERIIEGHKANVERGAALVRMIEGDAQGIAADAMLPPLSELTLFSDFRPATAALDNLVGAGGLGLFQDAGLQLAVSKYGQALEDHHVLQAELAQFQLNHFMVFLREQVPLLETRFSNRMPEPKPASKFEFDPVTLANSLQFENLLLTRIRSEGDAINFAQKLLDSTQDLRARLESLP
jgi:hypothetical protein